MAHVRQSRPDSGLGFQEKVLHTFYVVFSLLASGREEFLERFSLLLATKTKNEWRQSTFAVDHLRGNMANFQREKFTEFDAKQLRWTDSSSRSGTNFLISENVSLQIGQVFRDRSDCIDNCWHCSSVSVAYRGTSPTRKRPPPYDPPRPPLGP